MSASKHHLYHRLQLAAHRAQKAADRAVMSAAGISTAQAAVLAIVAAQGPLTQRAIARQLGVNESAMTAMTGRLLRMGLIERLADEEDGRAWRLKVTEDGRTALKSVEQPFRAINRTLEGGLDDREIARMASHLARIADAFDAN